MGLDQASRMKIENRNPKTERSPKPEIRNRIRTGHRDVVRAGAFAKTARLQFFGIRHSDFFRISGFGIRISA
jgi:hypothetical protein